MAIIERLREFFDKYIFSAKWKCNICGKEIFNDRYFCDDCEKQLPLIGEAICEHCGRKTKARESFCSTCKRYSTSIEKGRSVFNYQKPIDLLIQKMKYSDGRYLARVFAEYLAKEYIKNEFNVDFITFIPMSVKAKRKRGYNQAELLAKYLSKEINLPIFDKIEKIKETKRQATLSQKERLLNVSGAFKVRNKKEILSKTILIVDDVTTTGSTLESVAKVLKQAGAKAVYYLTVASVPPMDNL